MNGTTDVKLTKKEWAAIKALQKLAECWPSTLWVFAGSGFSIVKTKPDGSRAVRPDGSYDQEYKAAEINIPCDAGDW